MMRASGRLRPPSDKSITQRALLFAALAQGDSSVNQPLLSGDTRSMLSALQQLGVAVTSGSGRVTIGGRGRKGFSPSVEAIDCGNSGTAARLLTGALSAQSFSARLVGDESLSARPMRRVTVPLGEMGASFVEENGDGLPLIINGGVSKPLVDYQSPVASAQVKTALLLAGYCGDVGVSLSEPARSRDHTERMFRALGLKLDVAETMVEFFPGDDMSAFETTIPADISSAAFLIAAALLADESELIVESVGLNPTRSGFLRVVERMGAVVTAINESDELGEPTADLCAAPAELNCVTIEPGEVPSLIDEVPILAVLAARATGVTVFHGVTELRYKESNRLDLLAENLRAIGVEAGAGETTLTVKGSRKPLTGRIETHQDHRIAMAFSVLNLLPEVDLSFSELQSPSVSYPEFFKHLEIITAI